RLHVLAVGADHVVIRTQHAVGADGDRFLPDIEMAEAADLADGVRLRGPLLEAAPLQHLVQQVMELLAVEPLQPLLRIATPLGRLALRRRGWFSHSSSLLLVSGTDARHVPAQL